MSTFTELVTNLNRMSQETPDLKFSEHDMDNYWDDLSEREREKAFYCVVKKLNQARKDKLSYRNTLYDEFEFDPNMYSMSVSSGFMELFNSYQTENDTQHVQRLEIIDEAGKANISMQISKCKTSIDDNGTTVKLIVTTDQED